MNETTEKIRNAVRHLILEGLEVSVTSVQDVLRSESITVQNEQVTTIIEEEGGPFPEYQGLIC